MYVRTYLWMMILSSIMNWFPYVEIIGELWNWSKLLIRGSRVRWQINTQQLHQIMTCKCGCLTVSLVILTIRQYKIYDKLNRKIIHKVSILSGAETQFLQFCYVKRLLAIFRESIDQLNGIQIYFESFYLSKYILILFYWKMIILVLR